MLSIAAVLQVYPRIYAPLMPPAFARNYIMVVAINYSLPLFATAAPSHRDWPDGGWNEGILRAAGCLRERADRNMPVGAYGPSNTRAIERVRV